MGSEYVLGAWASGGLEDLEVAGCGSLGGLGGGLGA